MSDNRDNEAVGSSSSGDARRFLQNVQPHRDPQLNWEVDVAKNLEEYLLKICAGDVNGGDEDGALSVNFAEAALLIQGSVQVYSKKVEYLYSLVLNALEHISQKRQQDQTETTPDQPEGASSAVVEEDDDPFLGLDDVPVDPKNSLDDGLSQDDFLNKFVKPPANLVVLEGDCFDANGDAGELDSYLLATHDLYRDFILLDPSDAGAVDDFLKGDEACTQNNVTDRGSLPGSKTQKSIIQSPSRRSGGTPHKSPLGEGRDADPPRTPPPSVGVGFNDDHTWLDPPAWDLPENDYHEDGMNVGYEEPMDGSDSDNDKPWKLLDPYEPGNLKIKPYKRVKPSQEICPPKPNSLATEFPVARLHGLINPEFSEIWEARVRERERLQGSKSPSLYEKLRQSLTVGEDDTCNPFSDSADENEDNDTPDFGEANFDMPNDTTMEVEASLNHDNSGADAVHFGENEVHGQDDLDCDASLEDLCRSHLDALLASIAETETQTELAARVSNWKQGIEDTLEEQDSRPSFDIHEYSDRILEKLSSGAESDPCMSFSDVVRGQERHDVARIFASLLQLVNNGDTSLIRDEPSGEAVCYEAVNPFLVRLLNPDKKRERFQFRPFKKRVKSPNGKDGRQSKRTKSTGEKHSTSLSSSAFTSLVKSAVSNGNSNVELGNSCSTLKSAESNGNCSVDLENCSGTTPNGKRRRKSRLIDQPNEQPKFVV